MVQVQPRGIRNNNPLNIRISNNNWLGKDKPPRDPAFETFQTMEYGIRAAFIIIRTYINKYKCIYLSDVIKRFAPPTENNTNKYINFVRMQTDIYQGMRLNFDNKEQMVKLLVAMSQYETGRYMGKMIFESVYEKYFSH